MATVRFQVFGDLFTDKSKQKLLRNIKLAVNAGLHFMQGKIVKETPVGATGNLRSSIQVSRATVAVLDGKTSIIGFVGTNLLYAHPVEVGTPPHGIPRNAIEGSLTLWAKRKFKLNDKEAKSMAYAVATNIRKRGTSGKFYFRKGVDKSKKVVREMVDKAFRSWSNEVGK